MTQNKTKRKKSYSLIKKLGLIIVGLFLLYMIAGFWVLPPLLKPRLEKELSAQIGRKVTIEEIKINPLKLSATTVNLTVSENDGEPFAGFKELLVDAELSSIVRWAVTFKEIRLTGPFAVIKVLSDKTLNISDILTKFSQTEPEPEEQAGMPRAVISKLQVEDGKFTVEDLSGAEPVMETLSPITFTLTNLSTFAEREGAFKFTGVGPLGGNYQLDGKLSVDPMRVQGSYSTNGTHLSQLWKHIKDEVSFQIQSGTTATSGNYLLELIDGKLHAKLQQGVFELNDFQLTEKGEDTVLISIPSFAVQGISADVKAREIIIEQVKTADARIESWIASDGTFNLLKLIQSAPQTSVEKKKSRSTEPKKETKSDSTEPESAENSPWHATINKIEVDKWAAAIEDRTLPEPVRLTVDDLTVRVENLANKQNARAKVALVLQINRAGTVKVDGSASIDPLSADLAVLSDKIALKPFQPYVDSAVKARIVSGTTSSKGRVLYQGKDGQLKISYQGEMSLDGVEIKDRIQSEDFISQKQIKASGIALNLNPNKLQVADIVIDKTHASVTIDQNGTVNVVQAFTPVPTKGEKGEDNLIERLVNFLILQIKGPLPMAIDEIRLKDIAVDFIDESITPSYKTNLVITDGTMKGMSSDPADRADFNIDGTIDQSATIKSTGQMNPLNAMHYAKVDFSLKDFALKPVSPYSAKYVGYIIANGSLDLKLKYQVDNNRFTGDNQIVIDQLELGDKVDSPEATDLPVALAVTVLKGADGIITLQVPVSGDVDDPQFDFGQTILSALTGVVKDVSAPPATASADGAQSSTATDSSQPSTTTDGSPSSTTPDTKPITGEELRFIEFEFGHAELSERAMKKLDVLANFLNKTPAIAISIEGSAEKEMDRAEMPEKQARKESPGSKQNDDSTQQKVPATDRAIGDNRLQKLARMRADIVKNYLIQEGKVPAERIQLKPVRIISSANKTHGRVELYLSIQ